MKFVKPERVFLKGHPEIDERWVQDRIAEDPSLLGLGDLMLRDREREQPKAGRLDLLLFDPSANRRYEVELQLGALDESHIIRTLEYWDIERKRFPQYDHCAVIVAEEITARFLNVISLFNGTVPLIALQMTALKYGDSISLLFVRVMDEVRRGLVEEDEPVSQGADRAFWEEKGSKETVALADHLVKLIQTVSPTTALKFNRHYIGLEDRGRTANVVTLLPRKGRLNFYPRIARSEAVDKLIDDSGLESLAYDGASGRYRISLGPDDLATREAAIIDLLRIAFQEDSAA